MNFTLRSSYEDQVKRYNNSLTGIGVAYALNWFHAAHTAATLPAGVAGARSLSAGDITTSFVALPEQGGVRYVMQLGVTF